MPAKKPPQKAPAPPLAPLLKIQAWTQPLAIVAVFLVVQLVSIFWWSLVIDHKLTTLSANGSPAAMERLAALQAAVEQAKGQSAQNERLIIENRTMMMDLQRSVDGLPPRKPDEKR